MKFALFSVLASVVMLCGCSVESAGHVAKSTVSFAGKIAQKTTVTAIKTSGHVVAETTKTAVHSAGSITKTVVTTPLIILKDTTTGITRQIPYSEGIRLYAATQTAKFDMALKGFELIRNGTPVMKSAWAKVKAGSASDPVLHAGDVIQVSSLARPKSVSKHS